MKRVIDVLIALTALLASWPIMLIIAALIKITTKGPVIYVQSRVGLNESIFQLYKFRSMVSDSDRSGDYRTKINDSRITPIGRVLRKYSLDELPQFFNILKGEMSVVGPRPDTPMQKERYDESEWILRTSVKPGLTGLAQATRRSLASHEERLRLDFKYIEQQSLWLDLKIILLTFSKISGFGSN